MLIFKQQKLDLKMKSKIALFLTFLHQAVSMFNASGQIKPADAIKQMYKGINLGNTLEPPNEAGWNNPKAEEYYFDLYKVAGFQCIRIPVRWDNHTSTISPFKID